MNDDLRNKSTTEPTYVLVTAAHNEEAFIEKTIESVAGQTILPAAWVIVSDGSTDSTDAIVQSYTTRLPFLHLLRRERNPGRNFILKAQALLDGFSRVKQIHYDFIGNLDADISFGSSYYQMLLKRFSEDHLLGLAGGWIHEEYGGKFCIRDFNSSESVPHAVQLFRRACYEAVGDYLALPYGGEDTVAVLIARMKGWEIRSFPQLVVLHHRQTSSAGGLLRNFYRMGLMDFSLGYYPAFEVLKCARRLRERPFVIGAILRMAGFASAYCSRKPRSVPLELVNFLRKEQKNRMRSLFARRPR